MKEKREESKDENLTGWGMEEFVKETVKWYHISHFSIPIPQILYYFICLPTYLPTYLPSYLLTFNRPKLS